MSQAHPLMAILDKIGSKDRDFRYMATSDLLAQLQKDMFKADPETERRLCAALISQLEDVSGDISGMAVKCLGLLARKVTEQRAEETVKTLCDKLTTVAAKKEQQRDIAGIALKTIITEVTGGSLAARIANVVTTKMLDSVAQDASPEVVGDALDALSSVLLKFGGLVVPLHARVQASVLPLLEDGRQVVRKRALQCVAAGAVYLADDQLASLMQTLLSRLQQPGLKAETVRTYVQATGQVSRAVGYRFGPFVASAVPLLVSCCQKAAEGDDELRELCLQALEGIVQRSPHEARAHLEVLLRTSLASLKYDPNFADDDDGDAMDDDDDDGDADEDEGGDDDAYSDDEEQSWKVRRAAAKTLSAILATFPDAVPEVYAQVAPELVARFKEREENVRVDVFAAYALLARQVALVARQFSATDPASPLTKLSGDVPAVLRALGLTIKGRSLKPRASAFSMLRELAAAAPVAVAQQLGMLTPGITSSLLDKNSAASTLKIEVLLFTRSVLASGMATKPGSAGPVFTDGQVKELCSLATAIMPCAQERYYKIASEALRALEALLLVLRPSSTPSPPPALPGPLQALVPGVFGVLNARLVAQDQDQEVKEAAISGMATLLAQAADLVAPEVPGVLRVLLDRLRNEVTRLTAVRGWALLAASPQALDLQGPGVMEPLLAELTSFLRKALRPLRQASLVTLELLSTRCGPQLSPTSITTCLEEATALVSEVDLPMATLALRLLASLVSRQPTVAGPAATAKALPAALLLLKSPLLQASCLEALQLFLGALAGSGVAAAAPPKLLQAVVEVGQGGLAATAQTAVAQCVAVLACGCGAAQLADTVQQLVASVDARQGLHSQRLALLCLGEIGRRTNLSELPQVEAAITSSLSSDAEEIKSAASLALGGVACGNLRKFMPSIIRQISAAAGNAKQQYLLLTALSEVITTLATAKLAGASSTPSMTQDEEMQVLGLLLGSVAGAQEECRNVIAECLGRLAQLSPDATLPQMVARVSEPSAEMRAAVASAVKYMVVDGPHPIDAHLASHVRTFLDLMGDADRHVRRAAVVSLSAVAHQKPSLVAQGGVLAALLPLLYAQTVVREELIRTVDLGPFKHKIDDGLELRKAAFECLDILLDSPVCRPQLDPHTFITHLTSGLGDHADVKTACHLMVLKLAALEPVALLAGTHAVVEPLERTLQTKLKSDAVKQEIERHEEMLRSCLRAVDCLASLPDIASCAPFDAFMRKTVLVQPMLDKYMQVKKERLEAEGVADASVRK